LTVARRLTAQRALILDDRYNLKKETRYGQVAGARRACAPWSALRGIDQEQRGAGAANALQVVALLSGLPIDLLSGTTEQGSSSDSGVSKNKGVRLSGSLSGSFGKA